jgi:hypothetical protein
MQARLSGVLGVVSKHISIVNHTSDFQYRPPWGVDAHQLTKPSNIFFFTALSSLMLVKQH